MARKQTSFQRRAVDRGKFNQRHFFGFTFYDPPRRWGGGDWVRGNRNTWEWPWPYARPREPKTCVTVPCPPFETWPITITD